MLLLAIAAALIVVSICVQAVFHAAKERRQLHECHHKKELLLVKRMEIAPTLEASFPVVPRARELEQIIDTAP